MSLEQVRTCQIVIFTKKGLRDFFLKSQYFLKLDASSRIRKGRRDLNIVVCNAKYIGLSLDKFTILTLFWTVNHL